MKFLLFPFSLLYAWVSGLRNHLYDLGIWKSVEFDVNVIVVGNLQVGGAGKSPMVEYLIKLLQNRSKNPAILSRGYKRKTRGFRLAGNEDTPQTLGDEPFQFWKKYNGKVPIAVGEERVMAIPEIVFAHETCDTVVCDDAFQHRPLRSGLSLMLSTYSRPFFNDHVLPMGLLREQRKGASRANAVIFTKCESASTLDTEEYKKRTFKYVSSDTPVFFTRTVYQKPLSIFGSNIEISKSIVLVTGLANSEFLKNYVADSYDLKDHLDYSDHHNYSKKDVNAIVRKYELLKDASNPVSILTTEKDAVKLRMFDELQDMPVFYLPIEIEFIGDGDKFEALIMNSFAD